MNYEVMAPFLAGLGVFLGAVVWGWINAKKEHKPAEVKPTEVVGGMILDNLSIREWTRTNLEVIKALEKVEDRLVENNHQIQRMIDALHNQRQ